MTIADNLKRVRERIAAAAHRGGRNSEEIALMAVTKTFAAERIREAYAAEHRLFGENRVQEFAGKAGSRRDLSDGEWHMVGHLQTNKADKAAELFCAEESIEWLKLAEKLNATAEKQNHKLDVLIEIDLE